MEWFHLISQRTPSKDPIIKYENKQKGNFSLTAYDENSNTTYLAQTTSCQSQFG